LSAIADSADARGGAAGRADDNHTDRSLIEVLVTTAISTLTRYGIAVERLIDSRRPEMPTLLVSRQGSLRTDGASDRITQPRRRPSGMLLVFHGDHWTAGAATRHAFLHYVGDRHMPAESLATAVLAMLPAPRVAAVPTE